MPTPSDVEPTDAAATEEGAAHNLAHVSAAGAEPWSRDL